MDSCELTSMRVPKLPQMYTVDLMLDACPLIPREAAHHGILTVQAHQPGRSPP